MRQTGNRNQKTQGRAAAVCIASILLCLLGFSCSLATFEQTGRLRVVVGSETSPLDSSSDGELTDISSTIDAQVATYEVRLEQVGNVTVSYEQILTVDEQESGEASSTVQTTFDQLPTGLWTLRILARNASGQLIAYLPIDEQSGDRVMHVKINRGETTPVDTRLVPSLEGHGDVILTLDWEAVDDKLLSSASHMNITITSWNQHIDLASENGIDIEASDENDVDPVGIEEKKITFELLEPTSDAQVSIATLPAGVYELTVELMGSREEIVWRGAVLFRVRKADTVYVNFTLFDPNLETGSIDLSISEEMDPLSITLTGDSEILYGNANGFGDTETSGTYSVVVDGESDGNTLSYAWYVNDNKQKTTENSLVDLEFSETGQYTITVMVTAETVDGPTVWGFAQLEVNVVSSGITGGDK